MPRKRPCSHEGCLGRGRFYHVQEKDNLFCTKHKPEQWKHGEFRDRLEKQNCWCFSDCVKRGSFAFPKDYLNFENVVACEAHRLKGMIRSDENDCSGSDGGRQCSVKRPMCTERGVYKFQSIAQCAKVRTCEPHQLIGMLSEKKRKTSCEAQITNQQQVAVNHGRTEESQLLQQESKEEEKTAAKPYDNLKKQKTEEIIRITTAMKKRVRNSADCLINGEMEAGQDGVNVAAPYLSEEERPEIENGRSKTGSKDASSIKAEQDVVVLLEDSDDYTEKQESDDDSINSENISPNDTGTTSSRLKEEECITKQESDDNASDVESVQGVVEEEEEEEDNGIIKQESDDDIDNVEHFPRRAAVGGTTSQQDRIHRGVQYSTASRNAAEMELLRKERDEAIELLRRKQDEEFVLLKRERDEALELLKQEREEVSRLRGVISAIRLLTKGD